MITRPGFSSPLIKLNVKDATSTKNYPFSAGARLWPTAPSNAKKRIKDTTLKIVSSPKSKNSIKRYR